MRVIAYILTFLTLLLSAVPCCQYEEPCDDIGPGVCRTATSSGDDCPESEGPCSPFYACGTCPGCVEAAVMKWGEITFTVPKTPIDNPYLSSECKGLPQRLLRPPILRI